MKMTLKDAIFVNARELNDALHMQGLDENFQLLGDWFDYAEFGEGCFMELYQQRDYIEDAESQWDIQYNFALGCLKDMFGDALVMVEVAF